MNYLTIGTRSQSQRRLTCRVPWGDHADESEPWYGNDTDGGEFYDGPSSPASTQYFEESRRGEESYRERGDGRQRRERQIRIPASVPIWTTVAVYAT